MFGNVQKTRDSLARLANRFELWSFDGSCLEHCVEKGGFQDHVYSVGNVMRYISSICQRSRTSPTSWEPACHISAISDRLRRASHSVLRRLDFILKTTGNNQKILSMAVT